MKVRAQFYEIRLSQSSDLESVSGLHCLESLLRIICVMKSMKFSESLQKKTAQTPISFEVLVYQAVLVPIWAGYLWFKGILSPQLSTNMGVRTPSNHSHQKPNNIKHQIRKSELQSGVEDIGAHFFSVHIYNMWPLWSEEDG